MVTQEAYLAEFKVIVGEMLELTRRKNSDYAGEKDAFQNFRAIEFLSSGNISAHEGILVRMTDKLQRIINLSNRNAEVTDESVEDTLKDLAVYAIIDLILLRSQSVQKNSTN